MFCPFEHVAIFLFRVSSSHDALTTAMILNVPEDWVTTVTMQVLECASSFFDSSRSVFSGTLALLPPRFLTSCGGAAFPHALLVVAFKGTSTRMDHKIIFLSLLRKAWLGSFRCSSVVCILSSSLPCTNGAHLPSIAAAHLARRMQNRKHIPQPPLTSKVARLVVEKLKRRYVSWPGAEEQAELVAEWEEKTDMR